jgi:hypothetical protein
MRRQTSQRVLARILSRGTTWPRTANRSRPIATFAHRVKIEVHLPRFELLESTRHLDIEKLAGERRVRGRLLQDSVLPISSSRGRAAGTGNQARVEPRPGQSCDESVRRVRQAAHSRSAARHARDRPAARSIAYVDRGIHEGSCHRRDDGRAQHLVLRDLHLWLLSRVLPLQISRRPLWNLGLRPFSSAQPVF